MKDFRDESPLDCGRVFLPGSIVGDGRRLIQFRVPEFTVVRGPKLALANDWRILYRGEYYNLPYGFATDGASIPRPLWWLCGSPFDVPRLYAAIVHDWLYSGGDKEATRADADDLYRDLQIALGVARWKAYAEWAALRVFGGSHWCANDQAFEKISQTDDSSCSKSLNNCDAQQKENRQ